MVNKGFSFDLNEDEIERPQRTKFQAEHLDFDDSFSSELWFAAHTEPSASKTGRFITLSAAAHAIFFAGLFTLVVPMFETPKTETVTIEIADTGAPLPRGVRSLPSASAAPAQAPTYAPEPISKEEPASADDVVAAAKPEAKEAAKPREAAPAKPVAAKAEPVKTAPVPAARTAVADVEPLATESEVEVPAKVEDLEAEELDENMFQAKAAGDYEDGDLDRNFAEVDRTSAEGLATVKDEIAQDADKMAEDDLGAIERLDRENQDSAKMMAARAEELKRKNAAALAAALAKENAAREQAAREQAARLAAAKAAQDAAQARAAGNGGEGRPTAKANGGSGNGSGQGAAGGIAGGVRALESLRQMPGNPKPSYSEAERYAKQQGDVSFLAYVNRDGYPTQFRQVRSTGHANLDGKTLAALKKWRFYPGQEGWVEIPIRWDLRGGVQETSALANRRSAGPSPGRLLRTSN